MRLSFLTLLFLFLTITQGYGDSQLNRLSRSTVGNSVKLFAFFDKLPLFNERLSGKRLDITLNNTAATETLILPDPDDTIIKTLLITDQNKATLSLFFSYVPQDISITASEADTLIIDLIPGNKFTRTYKELTADLGRLSIVERYNDTIVNPVTFTTYSSDWKSFIKDFEIVPQISPSLSFYFPSFPLLALLDNTEESPDNVVNAVLNGLNQNDWFDALRQIQKQITISAAENSRKYLVLIHADILFRIGNVEAAYEQFELLQETYGNESVGALAHYAMLLIDAENNGPYKAHIQLKKLQASIGEFHSLSPYLQLSLAETALATGHYQQVETYLDVSISPLPATDRRKQLRRADLFYTTDRIPEALNIYRQYAQGVEIDQQPYSLNGYCTILYRVNRFAESRDCYQNLAPMLHDQNQAATAFYLAALSQFKQYPASTDETEFAEVISRYPNTEASYIAATKLNDLCFLNQPDCTDKAVQTYHRLAEISRYRSLSEEASFKEALVMHLSGNSYKSVELLMEMLRNFQSGNLRAQAEALLIQILPGVLESHLLDGNDIKALALAQQNRILFENRWIESSLLYELGLAFERLTLYREAMHLFLYLRNLNEIDTEEDVSFALTRIAHANGDHYLVEEFSSEYFYNFPNGRYHQDVLFYRIDSLYASGLNEQALGLMPDPVPERSDFKFLAASLYFQNDDYQQVINLLLPPYRYETTLPENDLYILAESLFQAGRIDESTMVFNHLENSDQFKEASLYRLAQTSNPTLEAEKKLSLVRETGTTSKDKQWQRFAGQELRYNELISNL